MFREMRRKDKMLPLSDAKNILANGDFGVLSLAGEYPYGVPLSYIYEGGAIYFHCANKGLKLELLEKCDKVCFTVARQYKTIPEKFSVDYESAILFGKASFVQGEEKTNALKQFFKKYFPVEFNPEEIQKELDNTMGRTVVVKIEIEHLSGKKSVD
jgi:nitroimidazol reductase NimA-like FMN-containing flavoprotein (pyridoxamine 5'-phosphate oxidase superfamily)